ncbi:MAG: hypothetical protein ACKOBV_07930, partial [Candidatus Kapaibacterium sp.]
MFTRSGVFADVIAAVSSLAFFAAKKKYAPTITLTPVTPAAIGIHGTGVTLRLRLPEVEEERLDFAVVLAGLASSQTGASIALIFVLRWVRDGRSAEANSSSVSDARKPVVSMESRSFWMV